MEKEKRENGKLSTGTLIILSIIFLITFILSIILYFMNNDLNNKYTEIENNYQKELNLNNEKIIEQNSIKENIEKLNNIEEEIEFQKEMYFKKIKELEDQILNGKSDKKIAYLTFDDGPYYLTNEYLEVLNEYDVKATFFTIGQGKERCLDNKNVSCYPIYKKIVENGHTIANHTYSHGIKYGLYNSTESFMTQVKKQEELIKKETGVITNIVRFPGGSATAKSKKELIINELRKNNYGWVDWTALDGDGASLSSKAEALSIFKNSINQDIEVVLLHDYNRITLDILPEIIEYLEEKGYILLPLFYESNMINK